MNPSYTITNATEGDISALRKFFSSVYEPDHITTNAAYLRWQYQESPANPFYPNYPNLLLKHNDEIVGHLGLIPYQLKAGNEVLRAAFFASLILQPELRGHGGGIILAREAEKYFDACYTTGYNSQAKPVMEFSRWNFAGHLTRWLCTKIDGIDGAELSASEVVPITTFDKAWDASWQELRSLYPVTIERSSQYLNWRFVKNPFINYVIFAVPEEAKFSGYIILRVEKGREFSACRIVDLIGKPRAIPKLILTAQGFAQKEQFDFIDFFTSSTIYDEALEKAGFYHYNPETSQEPPVFILPVDRSRFDINFAYKFVKTVTKPTQDWFVCKADGDKDRPQPKHLNI